MGGLPAPFFYFDRNFRSISKTTQFYSHPSYSRYGAAIFISVPDQQKDSGKVTPHSHTLAQPIKRNVGSCESHLVSSYLGKPKRSSQSNSISRGYLAAIARASPGEERFGRAQLRTYV